MDNNLNSDTNIPNGLGGLVVFVSTGDATRPIKDALVTISQREGTKETLIKSLLTDASGRTETVFLLAPPKEESLTPNGKTPYALYNIRVDYPGYYSVENIDAPVFSKIINIQPVGLIPLPLDTYVGKTKVFSESESEVLDMGKESEEDV